MQIILKKINGELCVINYEKSFECSCNNPFIVIRTVDGHRFRCVCEVVSKLELQLKSISKQPIGTNYLNPLLLYQTGIAVGGSMSTEETASRIKCLFADCNSKPAPIIGLCRYCSKKFCSSHRLPEAHTCSHLSACKSNSLNTLSERLLNEKCVADKLS